MTHFCWLPPDSAAASVSGSPPRTSNSRISERAARDHAPRRQPAVRGHLPRPVLAQGEVLGDREVEDEAAAVAVLGDVRDARRRPCRGRSRRCGRGPRRRSIARVDAPQAGDRLDELALAVAVDARPARRSRPRGPSGRRPARPAGRGRRATCEVAGPRGSARRRSSGALSTRRSTSRPTIRRASDASVAPSVGTVSIRLPRRRTVTRSAISSTSPSLCEMKTIALPSSRSARSTLNRSCGLLRGEHGGRLVEDEDLRVRGTARLQDLDALLLADRDVLDHRVGVDGEAEALGQLAHASRPPPWTSSRPPADRGSSREDDVLGHGHDRDQHEVLVHHADPEVDGPPRRVDPHRLAVARCISPSSGW